MEAGDEGLGLGRADLRKPGAGAGALAFVRRIGALQPLRIERNSGTAQRRFEVGAEDLKAQHRVEAIQRADDQLGLKIPVPVLVLAARREGAQGPQESLRRQRKGSVLALVPGLAELVRDGGQGARKGGPNDDDPGQPVQQITLAGGQGAPPTWWWRAGA